MSNELIEVVIKSRTEQGMGIAVMELVSANGKPLPEFTAGAHIDVHVGDGLVRQYSLCNDSITSQSYRIGVLNDPNSRGGSIKIHQDFTELQIIKICPPRNHFPLNMDAKKSILASGGIGITPMMAMAYELLRAGKDFELHYCTRSSGAGAFEKELIEEFGERVVFHYDDQDQSQLFSPKSTFSPVNPNTHIYVCGPTGFMDWVINNAKEAGYPSEQIHFEYFSADVDTTGESFEVYCEQSEITVTVLSDDTIAKALRKCGLKVNMSCEEGVCGTCITDVLEGEPDHRDHFLTDEEKADNDQIALCCSRAKSKRLVIDI
jgi:ferredoxin-NADP reductase